VADIVPEHETATVFCNFESTGKVQDLLQVFEGNLARQGCSSNRSIHRTGVESVNVQVLRKRLGHTGLPCACGPIDSDNEVPVFELV
jgi:hypothetical protein